jgi:type II pantothenate kinase
MSQQSSTATTATTATTTAASSTTTSTTTPKWLVWTGAAAVLAAASAGGVALYWWLARRRDSKRCAQARRWKRTFGRHVSFGLDMGGTLSKLVYFEPHHVDTAHEAERKEKQRTNAFMFKTLKYGKTGQRDPRLTLDVKEMGGAFHFLKFRTDRMQNFFKIIKKEQLLSCNSRVCATGGGARKFRQNFATEVNVHDLRIGDEIGALFRGLTFLLHWCPDECYHLESFEFGGSEPLKQVSHKLQFPFLVVNIGTGVSIVQVDGPDRTQYHRIGGSSIGGGTFLGLCLGLTGCDNFAEALELASRGKSSKVNLLIKDIYGGDYPRYNLSADVVAANFGKIISHDKMGDITSADLIRAALIMVTNNIGNLANLYAHKVLHVPRIVFVGNFLTDNSIAMRTLAYATHYWSKGKTPALFLRHEGYFGALGVLFDDADNSNNSNKTSAAASP